jgi:hypothetical protein
MIWTGLSGAAGWAGPSLAPVPAVPGDGLAGVVDGGQAAAATGPSELGLSPVSQAFAEDNGMVRGVRIGPMCCATRDVC